MKKSVLLSTLLLSSAITSSVFADNEVSVMAGSATRNINNFKSTVVQVEYKRYFTSYLAISGAYINEGHIENSKRDGLAISGWLSTNVEKPFVLFGGIGAYGQCDTVDNDIKHKISPILSVGLQYNINKNWLVKAIVSRTVVSDSQDSDVFVAGIGFKF